MSTAAPPELAAAEAPPPEQVLPPTPEDAAQLAPPPVAAVDPYTVETTVAAVGLPKFLDGSLRRLFLHHVERASGMADEIDRKVYRFLGLSEPDPGEPLPDFDFETARELVKAEPTPQQTTDVIDAFAAYPDLGLAAVQVYERVQKYLRDKMPHRAHRSILWLDEDVPAPSEIARWRRLWMVAADPMWVLDSLGEFAVSRGMVQALRDMYPLIWARVDKAVTDQLTRKKAQQPNFRLSVRKENMLRVLIQQETVQSRALGAAMQEMFAAKASALAQKQPARVPKGGAKETSAADAILSR